MHPPPAVLRAAQPFMSNSASKMRPPTAAGRGILLLHIQNNKYDEFLPFVITRVIVLSVLWMDEDDARMLTNYQQQRLT